MPATEREFQEISEDYSDLRTELEVLFKVGTNRPIVNGQLREATNALQAGDYRLARQKIAQARSTARTATELFLTNWLLVVRDSLLSAKAAGGDISTSRPLLITAKKALNEGDYRRVVLLTFKTFNTIGDLPEEYTATLKVLVKVRYNYTLVESYGLDVTWARGLMEMAFEELMAGNLPKAIDLADNAKAEVRRINTDFNEASKRMMDAREAIDQSRRIGVDVTQAESLLAKAMERFEANDMKGATELLSKTIDSIDITPDPELDTGERSRVAEDLKRIKEQIAFVKGLGLDTARLVELEEKAEEALARGSVELADDLVNQIRAKVPMLTAAYLNQRIEDANALIKETSRQGYEVEPQRTLLSEAMSAAAVGDLEKVVDVVDQVEVQVHTLRRRRTAKVAIDRGKRMGADLSEAEMYFAMGWKRQQDDEWGRALAFYSEAIDEAIAAGKAMTWQGED